jgi:hypothetical protein
MDPMTRRRAFADTLLTALGLEAAAPEAPAPEHRGLDWMLDLWGEDRVTAAFLRVGGDMAALRKELRREEKRAMRHAETRRRRERNGDTVLYRGPALWGDLSPDRWREVRNRANRRVAVIASERDLMLGRFPVPAGSRILIDLRHGMPARAMVELVRTQDDRMRLHIWGFKGEIDADRAPAFALPGTGLPDEDELFAIQDRLEA